MEWELKHLPFSLTNGEIGVNGKVNRSVIIQRYSSHIERMFNMQYTVRKPSRELTYIEEEEDGPDAENTSEAWPEASSDFSDGTFGIGVGSAAVGHGYHRFQVFRECGRLLLLQADNLLLVSRSCDLLRLCHAW